MTSRKKTSRSISVITPLASRALPKSRSAPNRPQPAHLRTRSITPERRRTSTKKSSSFRKGRCSVQCPEKYRGFGRSSDPDYDEPTWKLANQTNPCMEFEKDLECKLREGPFTPAWLVLANNRIRTKKKLALERRAEAKSPAASSQAKPAIVSPIASTSGAGDIDATETNPPKDAQDVPKRGEGEENRLDDEEDDEEEERGLPQAVRALCDYNDTPGAREVIRERRKFLMEEIARDVEPNELIGHLRGRGFFNHNYSAYIRCEAPTSSRVSGKKKSTEKLYSLLS